jgi:transitional endoplasmic reticulum ATPase
VSNDEAASLVPDGVSDYEEMTNFGHGDRADVFLRKFRESKGLPGDFDPEGFQEITEVTRIYLPFWLAEFRSDGSEKALVLSFRDDGLGKEAVTRHGWLSGFVAEDPTRLAEYGYEIRLDRVEEQLSEDEEDIPGDQPGVQNPAGRSPDCSFGGGGDGSGTSGAGGEITQPEDVDMEAESLVERGFGDVGGMGDLKETLEHKVVRPLEDPEAFEEYGIGVVNGVLLHGPPGCGKTYIAEALAGEVGHNFVEVSPADLTSKYMGEPADKVADLFAIAKANQPCLLFVDEVDAIAGARDSDGNMNTSEQQMVNQLLAELEDTGENVAARRAMQADERIDEWALEAAAADTDSSIANWDDQVGSGGGAATGLQ